MVEVMVSPGYMRLELTGLDIFWSLKRNLTFPAAGIRSVFAEPEPSFGQDWWGVARVPGTSIPSVIQAGTFYLQGGKEFWCVHYTSRSVVFELDDLPFTRIVVDVRDPEAVVKRVRAVRYEPGASV